MDVEVNRQVVTGVRVPESLSLNLNETLFLFLFLFFRGDNWRKGCLVCMDTTTRCRLEDALVFPRSRSPPPGLTFDGGLTFYTAVIHACRQTSSNVVVQSNPIVYRT